MEFYVFFFFFCFFFLLKKFHSYDTCVCLPLQMTNCVTCLFVLFIINQTYGRLTDNSCIWHCVYSRHPTDIRYCKMCAADPPITYRMCYAACQHNERSFELSVICDACLDVETKFMPTMCRLACRDLWYYPNIPVCKVCQETDILSS